VNNLFYKLLLIIALCPSWSLASENHETIHLFLQEAKVFTAGEGMEEVLKYRCGDLDLDGEEECAILWQWTRAGSWDVYLNIVNRHGGTLSSQGFGRSAMLLGTVPYSGGVLILVEYGEQQSGDVSCCPSRLKVATYRWYKGELQQLGDGELPETSRANKTGL